MLPFPYREDLKAADRQHAVKDSGERFRMNRHLATQPVELELEVGLWNKTLLVWQS
jgi:hypothetical protein